MKDSSLVIDAGNHDDMKKALKEGLEKVFPIDSRHRKLTISDIKFKDLNYDPDSWTDIGNTHKTKGTMGIPYTYRLTLTDKDTGKILSNKSVSGGILPTRVPMLMGSFMVDGNAYSIPLQDRLKPGAYSRISDSGDAEVFSNVKGSSPIRTVISPEKGKLSINIRQGTVPLYPVLKLFGVHDDKIRHTIGNDLFNTNADTDYSNNILKLYKLVFGKTSDSLPDAEQSLKEKFAQMETTPDVNERTLGEPFKSIDGDYLLSTASKVIKITRGDEPTDNRDSLINKNTMGIDDILKDTLARSSKMNTFGYKAKFKMDHIDDVSRVIDPQKIDNHIRQIFTSSSLSRYSDQTNPASMISDNSLTTLLGEGGVGSKDVVTRVAKNLQNSHMGFIDPVKTPESFAAGITLNISKDTRKRGNELETKVIDIRTGKTTWLPISRTVSQPLAFPGEFIKKGNDWVPINRMVEAVFRDRTKSVNASSVRYMIHDPSGLFSYTTNMIPFIQSNQGNRLLTGSKMLGQATILKNPEKPFVETVVDGKPILDTIGNEFSIKAREDGVVIKITDDAIILNTNKGKITHSIPNDIPLNEKSFIDANVIVKVGDRVKKGQLLSDTNFTKDGKYVSGVNFVTAYVPWQGLNHEDSAVITNSAAEKLASDHIYKITLPLKHNTVLGLDKYRAQNPYSISKVDSNNYDEHGIVKPGTVVKSNDTLIAALEENVVTGADSLISKLKKSSIEPFKDASVEWKKSSQGKVIDVIRGKKNIKVYVKTTEPLKLADKIVGRHGNKATVSAIIPDELAPVTQSGEKVDLLLDPLSVPSRINTGQLLETGAGKIAKKMGKPYIVNNFDNTDHRKTILGLMKDLNIPEKEDIFDPSTGKTLPKVFVGNQYISKLKYQVEHKMSKRGITGPYTNNNLPSSGKGAGGMSVDNLTGNVLLAHNARNILREDFNIKNNPNADYWRAIQHGELPPAPTSSFEWKKFENLLRGQGINTKKKGSTIKLAPLTDKDILSMSKGLIPSPIKTYKGKGASLTPDKNGIFGESTGGFSGDSFSHIKLNKVIPNPAYKEAIKSVLHLTDKEYEELL